VHQGVAFPPRDGTVSCLGWRSLSSTSAVIFALGEVGSACGVVPAGVVVAGEPFGGRRRRTRCGCGRDRPAGHAFGTRGRRPRSSRLSRRWRVLGDVGEPHQVCSLGAEISLHRSVWAAGRASSGLLRWWQTPRSLACRIRRAGRLRPQATSRPRRSLACPGGTLRCCGSHDAPGRSSV